MEFQAILDPYKKRPVNLRFKKTRNTTVMQSNFDDENQGPLSHADWGKAFSVYSTIYGEKHLNEKPALQAYCYYIQDMASKGGAWWLYDRQFRIDREHTPIPWNWFRGDLEREAFLPQNTSTRYQLFNETEKGSQQKSQSRGVCFKFNRSDVFCEQTAESCRWAHRCKSCGGSHPQFKCQRTESNSIGDGRQERPGWKKQGDDGAGKRQ